MKRLLLCALAALALLTAPLAPAQVTTDTTKTGDAGMYIGPYAFASLPAASSYTGMLARATDLGESGTLLISNGTRWAPMGGRVALKTLVNATASIGSTETISLQTQLPVGAWQVGDALRLTITTTKSGVTDAFHLTVRVGTAGTTADTALTGLSALAIMSAAGRAGGSVFDVKQISATSAQLMGASGASTSTYSTPTSGSAIAAATAITSAAANALFISVGVKSSGATDTVVLTSASLELITP